MPHHTFRVLGTTILATEQTEPLAEGSPRPAFRPRRTAGDFRLMEKRAAARGAARAGTHSAALLPPRFPSDIIPHVRGLKQFWHARGLSFR
jgi:hypothetical protein